MISPARGVAGQVDLARKCADVHAIRSILRCIVMRSLLARDIHISTDIHRDLTSAQGTAYQVRVFPAVGNELISGLDSAIFIPTTAVT